MYILKFNNDKSLTTVRKVDIYKNEKNADKLLIYIPQEYEDVSISECTVLIHCVKPSGQIISITPTLIDELYSGYRQYYINIDERITSVVGSLELWISVIDAYDTLVMRTSSVFLDVLDSREA